jgi:YVTN family beta-propeller protein
MKKRGVIVIAVAVVIGLGGLVASVQVDDASRKKAYIYANHTLRSLGLGVRKRDVEHMRTKSGMQDISNVNCRDCHWASTRQLAWAQPRPHHRSPEGLALSPDGRRLVVAMADVDEVAVLDTAARTVTRKVKVPGGPTGLAMDQEGRTLYVTCRQADRVTALDAQSLAEKGSVEVGLGPVGIAVCRTGSGDRLVVANTGSDDASVIDAETMKELARLSTGREPYGVASTPDGARALVSCRLAVMAKPNTPPASELTIIDPARTRVVGRAPLESAHLSEAAAAVPQRSWVLAPIVRVRNLVPITQVAHGWVMSSGLAISDPKGERVVQVPLDEANAYYADPAGLAVDASGRRAYIASGGGDAILVVDLERLNRWLEKADARARTEAIRDLELSSEYVVARIPTRRNPRQLALSPDAQTLYVAERLVDSILVINTKNLSVTGRIALGDGGDRDPIRRGERMFTTASKTFQRQFSCRSCHPDGHVDGLNYDFDGDGIGDNFLDNRSLQGLAGTWPYKWNGKNPSLKVQCGPRFAKVLMRTDPFTDAELTDLTAFVLSMPPARTVPASQVGQPLTEPQEHGRQIFFASKTSEGKAIPKERQCATCHMPPVYTNHQKTKIGTQGPYDNTDEFDTPHLLGVAASAPYLHDGRAKTLEELWTLYQTNDLHGVSSYMNKQQLNDLVAFLKTL